MSSTAICGNMGKIPFSLDLLNADDLSEGYNNTGVVEFVIARVIKSIRCIFWRWGLVHIHFLLFFWPGRREVTPVNWRWVFSWRPRKMTPKWHRDVRGFFAWTLVNSIVLGWGGGATDAGEAVFLCFWRLGMRIFSLWISNLLLACCTKFSL